MGIVGKEGVLGALKVRRPTPADGRDNSPHPSVRSAVQRQHFCSPGRFLINFRGKPDARGAVVAETSAPEAHADIDLADENRALRARLAWTERALERLRRSEADFRVLAERSADLIIRFNLDGVIEYASPTAQKFGFKPHELVGRRIGDLLDRETTSPTGNLARLSAGQPPTDRGDHEFRSRCGDGSWVWLQSAPSLVYDDAGEVIGVVTALRDVTRRRTVEAELERRREEAEQIARNLAESEARYRLISERVRDLIVQYDERGMITYISPAVRQFGLTSEEVVGRCVAEFEAPEDGPTTLKDLAGYAAGKPFPEGTLNQTTIVIDGRKIWLEGTQSGVYGDDGSFRGVVTVMRDVSHRRGLEDELRAKSAAAEAASEAKSVFLANMSHEMRTPLNGVIGFAAVLRTMEGLPEKARLFVDRIAASGQEMLGLVNDVLDVSRIETGHVELSPEPIDPRALIEQAVGGVRDHLRVKGLACAVRVENEVPHALLVDRRRLQQVLKNLLCNAVKFTDRGSVTVEASYLAADRKLRIAVIDTGVGVPADVSGRLFQRFSQADSSITRRHGGAGLGLAISKGLVAMMGGEIGMESQVGAGSTFWFTVQAPATP